MNELGLTGNDAVSGKVQHTLGVYEMAPTQKCLLPISIDLITVRLFCWEKSDPPGSRCSCPSGKGSVNSNGSRP